MDISNALFLICALLMGLGLLIRDNLAQRLIRSAATCTAYRRGVLVEKAGSALAIAAILAYIATFLVVFVMMVLKA